MSTVSYWCNGNVCYRVKAARKELNNAYEDLFKLEKDLQDCEYIQEKKLIEKFFLYINTDDSKVVYGDKETYNARRW